MTAFLSCWAYEEFFHGLTLRRFLEASGITYSPAAQRLTTAVIKYFWVPVGEA